MCANCSMYVDKCAHNFDIEYLDNFVRRVLFVFEIGVVRIPLRVEPLPIGALCL